MSNLLKEQWRYLFTMEDPLHRKAVVSFASDGNQLIYVIFLPWGVRLEGVNLYKVKETAKGLGFELPHDYEQCKF